VTEQPGSPPTLRLVRGDAAPEEIAALLAVLAARTAAAPDADPAGVTPRGGWADRARALPSMPQLAARTGPGAWRASGRPR
jgi:hypothetical protein